MTAAEDIRAALTVLGCEHRFPTAPPHGPLARPGNCRHCGAPYDRPRVDEALREPLANLLEEIARQYDAPPCDAEDGVCKPCAWRPDFLAASTLAQQIAGSTNPERTPRA